MNWSCVYKYLPGLLCSLLVVAFPATALAQASNSDSESDVHIEENKPNGDFWQYQELDEKQYNDKVSEGLEYTLNVSHRAANWLDSFFDDDRTVGIKNETRIKLSAWGFWEQYGVNDDSDFNFNIRIKLPRALKRAQIIFANEPDDELSNSPSGGIFPEQNVQEENFLGLRFFDVIGKKIPGKFSTAMGLGFSSGNVTFRIQPRYIYTHAFKVWSSTFLQKVQWHSRDGWSTETRLDFDRALSEIFFFRSSNELFWDEEDEDDIGVDFRPRLILSQRLSGKKVLLYEWNNLFYSKPDFDLNSTSLVLRYRQQIWRPWLFVEVAPSVAFYNETDWDATPGIFAKLEILAKKTDK